MPARAPVSRKAQPVLALRIALQRSGKQRLTNGVKGSRSFACCSGGSLRGGQVCTLLALDFAGLCLRHRAWSWISDLLGRVDAMVSRHSRLRLARNFKHRPWRSTAGNAKSWKLCICKERMMPVHIATIQLRAHLHLGAEGLRENKVKLVTGQRSGLLAEALLPAALVLLLHDLHPRRSVKLLRGDRTQTVAKSRNSQRWLRQITRRK